MLKIAIGLFAVAVTLCGAGQPAHAAPAGGSEIGYRLPDYPTAEAICEEMVKQGLEPSQKVCMRNEEKALATLRARWQRFPLRKRAQCVKDGAVAMMGASYDNLLWCLRQKK
jgi:hypothetical protein